MSVSFTESYAGAKYARLLIFASQPYGGPRSIVIDCLRAYSPAMKEIGAGGRVRRPRLAKADFLHPIADWTVSETASATPRDNAIKTGSHCAR
jgi:hypothetical protein